MSDSVFFLKSISPIDGRYHNKTSEFSNYFSEYALIKYRVFIEVQYFIELSNTDIKIHLNKIYSMPIFYILMTILGFVIINKLKRVKSKFFLVVFGIFVSVVVYYLNYFSGILGNKGALPIYLSVWLPLLILFLICNIGLVKVNEN